MFIYFLMFFIGGCAGILLHIAMEKLIDVFSEYYSLKGYREAYFDAEEDNERLIKENDILKDEIRKHKDINI